MFGIRNWAGYLRFQNRNSKMLYLPAFGSKLSTGRAKIIILVYIFSYTEKVIFSAITSNYACKQLKIFSPSKDEFTDFMYNKFFALSFGGPKY